VTPDGLGDNVLLQLRPSPRVVPDASKPEVTEPLVTRDEAKNIFQEIFDKGPPARWNELPEPWRARQKKLLEDYDKTVPKEFQLSEPTNKRIKSGLWPQFQIGAYPYCFRLTEYVEDSPGKPAPYRMGQSPGTHWYHAHKHGSTAINVLNGMAGVFVIEGDYDDALAAIYPDFKTTQKVLIVQNFGEKPNLARGNLSLGQAFNAPSLWVNGQSMPTITMRPGEIQLWRFVNASIRAVNTLLGFPPKDGAAPEIRQIAQDGVQFHEANYLDQPLLRQRPTGTPSNTFAPGNRVDLLVKAPLQAGTYAFTVLDTARNGPPRAEVLLNLEVVGALINPGMEFPATGVIGNYPKFPAFLADIDAAKIRIRRRLDFGWEPRNHLLENGSPPAPKFTIDDKLFAGDRYDQTMILGDYEEWTLTNSTARIAHPFHIHVNPFQVIEIYDPNSPDKIYKPDKNFVWQDVIAIPPAKLDPDDTRRVLINPLTGKALDPGYVKIRHPFVDFPGSYVLHCHMLAHEDRGMMQLIRVIPGADQLVLDGESVTMVPHH
jgi:FtsP/CotA-like multicopper oxidase with cupredoxin domain